MRQSAGILLFRIKNNELQFLLVHPGGPFWSNKDTGVWSISKGEFDTDEDALTAAKREFFEETGVDVQGNFIPLTSIKQKAGKVVQAWAVEGALDTSRIKSNTFSMQWPPKSGRWIQVPEIDKAEWFNMPDARTRINAAQLSFIDELCTKLQNGNV